MLYMQTKDHAIIIMKCKSDLKKMRVMRVSADEMRTEVILIEVFFKK